MDLSAFRKKVLRIFLAVPIVLGLFFFAPAGTLDYWQAWAYIAVICIPMAFVVGYFMKKDPEFLERRLKTRETEERQKLIIKAGTIIFILALLIPGLDRRFGWSQVPPELSLAACLVCFLAYVLIFIVFKENSYAARTVEVEKGQKLISTGTYSIIRHPMYLGSMLLYSATPIALGSYIAFPFFLFIIPTLVFRILNEEEVLRRDLPGYTEYCKKTKYRLIPFVW